MSKRVLIAVPNTGVIDALLSQRIIQMMLDIRHKTAYVPIAGRPRDVPRSQIMRLVLVGNYDFLIMIDSDNPPCANVLDLIELDKPVICCPTPFITLRPPFQVEWNVWCKDGDGELRTPHPMPEGLFEIEECGAGLLVLRRDVIEHFGPGAFASSVDPETGISRDDDDTQFCRKCQRAGIKMYAHGGYLCRHRKGGVDLYDVMQAYHPDWIPGEQENYTMTVDVPRSAIELSADEVARLADRAARWKEGAADAIIRTRERTRVETTNQAMVEAGH